MATIYDAEPNELIEKTAEELAKISSIKPPEWASFVKTGRHKERPPIKDNWWYIRAAALMRTIYRFSPVGVSKLRVKYGGRKGRGYKTERFYKGSGSIIRKILQQLEQAGFLAKEEKKIHKGRYLTQKGKSFLDKIADQIAKVPKKTIEKKEEPKEAPPIEEEIEKSVEKKETKPIERKGEKAVEKKPEPKKTEDKVREMVKKTKEKAESRELKAEDLLKDG